jgi:sarcosine oxidase subunit gamma
MAEMTRDLLAHRAEDIASVSTRTRGSIVVDAVPFLAQVDLRLDPRGAGRAPYPLPLDPNTAWEEESRAALWLGPDEWLILGPPRSETEIVRELETALGNERRSIVDVSSNRVALQLSGPAAKELLSVGCSLDLHPRSWTDGSCAQTTLASSQVILHERSAATRVLVRQSFADHLVDWMLEVATAF